MHIRGIILQIVVLRYLYSEMGTYKQVPASNKETIREGNGLKRCWQLPQIPLASIIFKLQRCLFSRELLFIAGKRNGKNPSWNFVFWRWFFLIFHQTWLTSKNRSNCRILYFYRAIPSSLWQKTCSYSCFFSWNQIYLYPCSSFPLTQ